MSSTKIEVLFEGKTEQSVLGQFCSVVKRKGQVERERICNHDIEPIDAEGEKNIRKKLRSLLKDLPLNRDITKRILVLRDLDNKDIHSRCNSIVNIVKEFDSTASFEALLGYDHVFILRSALNNLRLVLHVANRHYDGSFLKATTDDYVLDLALRPDTAKRLLEKPKRKNGWEDREDMVERIQRKVMAEIPKLLKENGMPPMPEAKQHVRFYAAILDLHTSPAVFAQCALASAKEGDIREVFASQLAAIEYLGKEL